MTEVIPQGQSAICFLPAMHGDAFFLHCYKNGEEGYVVVDGGPSDKATKNIFVDEVEKLPRIDLMTLSHQDADHIEGIRTYVNHHIDDRPFPVRRLWINCAREADFSEGGGLSATQASKLADMLIEINRDDDIQWKDYVTKDYDTSTIKFADITILSPEVDMLKRFIPEYEKHIKQPQKPASLPLTAQDEENDLKVSLKDLAKRGDYQPKESVYSNFVNMVSITFLLECDGLSVLMLGDSYAKQIEDALREKGFSKERKLKVDFVKVAHHGSKFNMSCDLLDMIDCNRYLIPTNGGDGDSYHPNREALAKIICHPKRNMSETVHFYFNYTLESIASENHFELFQDDESEKYNFVIHQPDDTELKPCWLTKA